MTTEKTYTWEEYQEKFCEIEPPELDFATQLADETLEIFRRALEQ